MNIEEIKNLLSDISQFEILDIINNSEKHSGHKGIQGSSYALTHIEIRINNTDNLSKIDIHRKIYDKLDREFKKGLHSVEIKILNG